MFEMLKDCLCHPKYIVLHYREKSFKVFLLIFLFFVAYVGACAVREYNTDYFSNIDNEEIIQAIVIGEDNDIVFDAEANILSGSPISYSSTNYNICFFENAPQDAESIDSKVTLIFTDTKINIMFFGMKVSEYDYTNDSLKSFNLELLSKGSVNDIIAFKEILTKAFDNANFAFSTISIVDRTTTVLVYYFGLILTTFFFSFLSNPGIGKGIRFKLCCLDSVIFILVMIFEVMFNINWLIYVALMLPVFYSNITFRHIARKV